MGFGRKKSAKEIPRIWKLWKRTPTLNAQRSNLMNGLKAWAKHMGLRLDPRVFFYKSFFDDVTNCRFNPGGPVPSFATCDRGLVPLVGMPKMPEQIKRAKKIEKKAEETKGRQTLGDSLALDAADPTAPPATYDEFRDMCITFAGMLFLTILALIYPLPDYRKRSEKIGNTGILR